MAYHYQSKRDERDPHRLPNIWTQEFTTDEAAQWWLETNGHDAIKYLRRFPLHAMSSVAQRRMIDAVIEEQGIESGWFYCVCLPGCMPDGDWTGPFGSEHEAVDYARDFLEADAEEWETEDDD